MKRFIIKGGKHVADSSSFEEFFTAIYGEEVDVIINYYGFDAIINIVKNGKLIATYEGGTYC